MSFEIPENMTFEQAMERLEKVTEELERGTLGLAQSMQLYEEGRALSAYCQGLLSEAGRRITELTQEGKAEG